MRLRMSGWLRILTISACSRANIEVGSFAGAAMPYQPTTWNPGSASATAATVFQNDWFDFDSDRRNRNAGPFTGGSRVLVDGRLDRAAMRKGIGLSILGAASALIALLAAAPAGSASAIAALYAIFALLAMAYTVPPLKFSHRGFGELNRNCWSVPRSTTAVGVGKFLPVSVGRTDDCAGPTMGYPSRAARGRRADVA